LLRLPFSRFCLQGPPFSSEAHDLFPALKVGGDLSFSSSLFCESLPSRFRPFSFRSYLTFRHLLSENFFSFLSGSLWLFPSGTVSLQLIAFLSFDLPLIQFLLFLSDGQGLFSAQSAPGSVDPFSLCGAAPDALVSDVSVSRFPSSFWIPSLNSVSAPFATSLIFYPRSVSLNFLPFLHVFSFFPSPFTAAAPAVCQIGKEFSPPPSPPLPQGSFRICPDRVDEFLSPSHGVREPPSPSIPTFFLIDGPSVEGGQLKVLFFFIRLQYW